MPRRRRIDATTDQTCAIPPSTNSSIPVTKLLSSDARNTAAFAISSELPIRPIGTPAARFALNCPTSFLGRGQTAEDRRIDRARTEDIDPDLADLQVDVQVRANERTAALLAL